MVVVLMWLLSARCPRGGRDMATLVSARRALLVLGLATAGAMATAVTASAAAQPATGDIQAAGGATAIRFSHRTFGGRATSGFDAIDGGRADDCNGHGTHVAGTVGGAEFGVAKRVQLVAVRVLDCRGSGSVGSVVAGINWVTRNAIKPAVANMSLGGGPSASIDAAVNRSISAGVTYAIAAGNSNANA